MQLPGTTVQTAAVQGSLPACSSAWGWKLEARLSVWLPCLSLPGRRHHKTQSDSYVGGRGRQDRGCPRTHPRWVVTPFPICRTPSQADSKHLSLPEVAELGPSPSGGDPARPHRGHRRGPEADRRSGSLTAAPGREIRRGSTWNIRPSQH